VRIPRQVSGRDLVRALRGLGYEIVRQGGSHLRLTTEVGGVHHVKVVPNHDPIRAGTLSGLLKSVAAHHRLTVEEPLAKLEL